MNPHLTPNDLVLFHQYLSNISSNISNIPKVYLEFGCGGSTLVACREPSIDTILFVESDPRWYEEVKKQCLDINVKKTILPLFRGLNVVHQNNWGHPGPGCTDAQKKAYSEPPPIPPHTTVVVLVDGRFRVACCLKLFFVLHDQDVILFDDFLPRQDKYGVVLDYYDIIDQTVDHNMVVLRKKLSCSSPSPEIIQRYELDSS